EAGTLNIQNEKGVWRDCRPLSDGRPALKGGRILQARSGGDVIGAIVGFSAAHRSLFLFSAQTAQLLGSFGVGLDVKDFAIAYDGRRFVTAGTAFGLKVLVDTLSQVTVLDLVDDSVVCMFYVFRDQIAAWMPDGTRVGPVPIIGGRATPDGLERIGAALRTAA